MAFDSNNSPLLTPLPIADIPSYELASTSNVTGSSLYNTSVVWGGPGGTFQIITSGNLAQIAQLSTRGLVGINVPGSGIVSVLITGGLGIGITETGLDFQVAVMPSTTLQLTRGKYNGTTVGSPRDTVNLIAGTNTSVSLVDSGTSLNWTINSDAGAALNSPFVITQTDASLTGATNLGSKTTGFLFSTVTAGVSVLSIVALSSIPTLSSANTWTGLNTFNVPIVTSGAGILPSTIPTTSIAGTAVTVTTAQTITGAKTFTPKQIFTNSIQIPLGAAAGKVLGSDVSGNATWTVAGAGDVTLAGANVMTGSTSFNVSLPTSTVTPTTATQLVTKAYTDATFGSLALANTWVGTQTFQSPIQLPQGATVDYVWTCTNATTGAATWQASGGGTIATVSTTDATPTALVTIAVATNTALTINGFVVARNTSGTINNATGGRFTCTAINTGGVITFAASPDVTTQATSTASFNTVISGTNIVVEVTGIAATNYNWKTNYTTITL